MSAYSKHGERITGVKYAEFCNENLPDYLKPDSEWNIGKYQTVNRHVFAYSESKDGNYWIEFGKDYTVSPYLAYLCIGFTSSNERTKKEWHYLDSKK
jgi:hypothetical protein